jgi:hypothetical protein
MNALLTLAERAAIQAHCKKMAAEDPGWLDRLIRQASQPRVTEQQPEIDAASIYAARQPSKALKEPAPPVLDPDSIYAKRKSNRG